MKFDTILIVDWSGGNDRGPTPKKDAIWVCAARDGQPDEPVYLRNRQMAEAWITAFIADERTAGRRVLAGFDFAFGYPSGFGEVLTGNDDPFAIWDWFETAVQDTADANNRFDLAGQINTLFPGVGPFWGNALQRDIRDLPRKGLDRRDHGMTERREAEMLAKGAFAVWQLSGAGAVGSQVIMGLPMLARLRRRFRGDLRVWPFEHLDTSIALVEVWPSLIAKAIEATKPNDRIKDAHQVLALATTLSDLPEKMLQDMLEITPRKEGSILGLGYADILSKAVMGDLAPPPLRDDCFAMPQGAYWTPVSDALTHLETQLACAKGSERLTISQAAGRFLSHDVMAIRSHPPAPNSAVDGYGFAGPANAGLNTYALVDGRSAAGDPYPHDVPNGQAVRILTGANLPRGVDTVVLQEDISATQTQIAFHGPLKRGANARAAGEDMKTGDIVMQAGRKLAPADLATLSATGIGFVDVHRRLRVGVLSTGNELREAGATATEGQIYDANRPMLCATLNAWGYEVIDLGRAPDNPTALRDILDNGAKQCDAILTSGGASAGDEDHMSALLKDTGSLALWRIAMKPGRPLALGVWNGAAVFGLPGNPVAAMICTLIFARPALQVMAGGEWPTPQAFTVPAGFSKTKKAGRREYLRARLENGNATVFPSEGSGRVSGLSWATGLVEFGDGAQKVTPGDPVQYIPFSSFDI